jgi:hypothetical protein
MRIHCASRNGAGCIDTGHESHGKDSGGRRTSLFKLQDTEKASSWSIYPRYPRLSDEYQNATMRNPALPLLVVNVGHNPQSVVKSTSTVIRCYDVLWSRTVREGILLCTKMLFFLEVDILPTPRVRIDVGIKQTPDQETDDEVHRASIIERETLPSTMHCPHNAL